MIRYIFSQILTSQIYDAFINNGMSQFEQTHLSFLVVHKAVAHLIIHGVLGLMKKGKRVKEN